MKIQLIDFNKEMVAAWRKHFTDVPEVEIHLNSAFAVSTECVVSPSNGYGFLDGGFDAAIISNLGNQVQIELQRRIKEEYHGEILVGQALLFETVDTLTVKTVRFLGWLNTFNHISASREGVPRLLYV